MMDYRKAMGVDKLSHGEGVRIAILDSGTPPPIFNNYGRVESIYAKGYGCDDVFGHATAVGSILFGGDGIIGLCEGAKPTYIRVLDDNGCGSVRSVSNGIYRAIESDVDLINLSLGFIRTDRCPKELEKACDAACQAGKTIICAAGNDGGRVNWPAALKTTICVGSADKTGNKLSFSSYGEVDFVAPGVNLSVYGVDGSLKHVSGTSFSTAIVTGVSAVLVDGLRRSGVLRIDIDKVRNALRKLTVDSDVPGWDENTGFGLISGVQQDVTVGMMIEKGFFGKIIQRLRVILGLDKNKE